MFRDLESGGFRLHVVVSDVQVRHNELTRLVRRNRAHQTGLGIREGDLYVSDHRRALIGDRTNHGRFLPKRLE